MALRCPVWPCGIATIASIHIDEQLCYPLIGAFEASVFDDSATITIPLIFTLITAGSYWSSSALSLSLSLSVITSTNRRSGP